MYINFASFSTGHERAIEILYRRSEKTLIINH